ncbi:hypothetical protein CRE_20745 [Caenorhabditis remanei]|uniref:ATP-dependent DNA helicase n=1 Tax=Caenorhabditis remanei TaxID=31234 RepID=E3MFC8_CAERE|nr:hypothetical protein CRE_20745 [Caenorhabditis remanei]
MPCEHCPHCKEQEAIAAVLAERMSQNSFEDFPNVVQELQPMEEVPPLNPCQQPVALDICNNWKEQKLHFIEGNANSGKTYLLSAMWALLKNMELNVEVISSCPFPRQSKPILKFLALPDEYIEEIDIILIDNANQITEQLMKSLSEKLKRVMSTDAPFGGKTIVLAADFGQLLPFGDFKNKSKSTLKHLTENIVAPFKKHTLVVQHQDDWSLFLDNARKSTKIAIPTTNIVKSIDELIEYTYGPLYTEPPHLHSMILTPKKNDVDLINKKVLEKIKGKELVLEALFNGKKIRSDLDLHELRLKKGSILILEEPFEGLAKGTRLFFEDYDRTHLNCRVIENNKLVDIERVNRFLAPKSPRKSFKEEQQSVKQFPVALGFASTIHTCQGRRFVNLGLFKLNQCFEHGMLYTALSRVGRFEGFRVLADDNIIENKLEPSLV